MFYTIYLHRNKINNKVYIGQTFQYPLEKRWKNGAGYRPCIAFYAAIQKYGWDNFEHQILEQGEWDHQTADEKERYYIQQYNACNPQYGYNINEGGSISISPNALPAALEWMQNHPDFGKARALDMLKWQAEHPDEMLKMRQASARKASAARCKPVQCIETGVIYKSASEAARQNPGTTQSKICMVCRGQRNTCGKLHWRYIEQE